MRIFVVSLIFFVTQLSVSAELKAPRPEISVQNYNEVNANRTIYLKDIAQVFFVAPTVAKKALALSLIDSIGENEKIEYKNSDIVKLIKEKLAEESEISDLKWAYFVPEKVTLIGRKNLISESATRSDLILAIQSSCQDCRINIQDLKIPKIRERQSFETCHMENEQIRAGTFLAPVVCQFNSEKKTYWVTGNIRISKNGPVANRQINSGEKVQAKDVRIDYVDLTYAKDSLPTLDEVVNQIANKGILVNQPIFKGDLKKELAVNRGQVIRAISGNETFEVTSQMLAEEQGYLGDLIRIKNTDTQKVLSGQIIDKGVVRVQ